MSATSAGYKKAGPIRVLESTQRDSDGNPLTLTFTGVAVKVTGSDQRMEAKGADKARSTD